MVDSEIPLKKDSRIELSFQGLTGVGNVEIKGGNPDLPDLLDQPGVPELTASSSAFEDLMSGARETMSRADRILSKFEALVDDNGERVSNTIANVESFTTALNNNSEGIDTFLSDVSGAAKGITSLSHHLEDLSDRAETLLAAVDADSIRQSVGNVETFTDQLASASTRFDDVVADASEAAKSINTFSANLNTSLGKVDTLVDSVDPEAVRTAVASLQNFATTLDASSDEIGRIMQDAQEATGNVNEFTQSLVQRKDDVNAILTDARQIASRLNAASKRVDTILGKVDGMLSDEEGNRSVIEEVKLAARSIREVADRFGSRADEISDGLARFSNRGLRDVESMVNDARRTLRRLEGTVDQLEDDPSSLIFGGDKVKTYERRH